MIVILIDFRQNYDFIAEKPGEKQYIQVTYLLSSKEVFEREFGVLRDVKDKFPKLVLSMDADTFGASFDGIERKNIIAWLLNTPK
jgi:predicted AAA+ superfamily ATPase